jgi:hypothetical protein
LSKDDSLKLRRPFKDTSSCLGTIGESGDLNFPFFAVHVVNIGGEVRRPYLHISLEPRTDYLKLQEPFPAANEGPVSSLGLLGLRLISTDPPSDAGF